MAAATPAALRAPLQKTARAGRYILDFFCPAHHLAIEIDGEAHERGDRPTRDEERDAWLRNEGITVLRIPARDVLRNRESVVSHIIAITRGPLPLHQPAAGPPPPPGEDVVGSMS